MFTTNSNNTHTTIGHNDIIVAAAATIMTDSLTAFLPTVFDSLFDFAQSDGFWDNIAIAFGTDYDVAEAEEIRTQWQNREFSQLPEIEIISDAILGNFPGGYAVNSNQIYLADSFIETASSEAILTVLLEEIGHFVDAKVNEVDTAGDEGELFSGLVREFDFSEAELTRIKAENDLNYIFFGDNLVALETSEPIILIVDTTVDENDGSADIGAGLSLRDAVSIANQSPNTPHIIELQSGLTYELTHLAYINDPFVGDRSLNIAGNITIKSNGSEYSEIVNNNNIEVIPGEEKENFIIINQGNSRLILNNIVITHKDGGGIYNIGNIRVENSLISDNADHGIDNYGTATLMNNTISDNNRLGIRNSGIITVNNNVIADNGSSGIRNHGSATINNNTITGNTRNGISNDGSVTIDNNTITGNLGKSGASGGVENSGTAILTNNIISNNASASFSRGGIFNSGEATVIKNIINDNYKSGIRNFQGTITLTNNTITGNERSGISNSGEATLTNNRIIGNTDTIGVGGGVSNNGKANLVNNIIARNTTGGGIYIADGGGIFNSGEINLRGNIITGNISPHEGGGIYNKGKATLNNNTITGNTANTRGGGIYNWGKATLTNNRITGNTASDQGGAIFNEREANVRNNIITANIANDQGGAIFNKGKANLKDNIITRNTASDKGGGIYNIGTWSSNSTISGNRSNKKWFITPEGELTTNPGYYDSSIEEWVKHKVHPTYPDIYDLGDTGSFTPLPPSPEPLPEPTISISDSWVEVEANTNHKTLVFEVELSSEYDKPIIVEYYTLDGSATSSDIDIEKDYNNISQNILTFLPGETKKEIEITVFGSSPVSDAALELFAKDTAYRDLTDANIRKLVDSVYDYSDLDDLGYKDYYIDDIITNDATGFKAVGLTADEDLFVVLSNPINAEIAENNDDDLLEKIAYTSGGTDTKAYRNGKTFLNQLNSAEQNYTYAKGTIYDQAKPAVLAITGTENSLDWFSNVNPKGVGYNQFIGSQADINQWLLDISNPEDGLTIAPHITGHSLGGALSQWVGGSYQEELGKIVTFNSPGISQQDGINLNASNNQGVMHYITSADLVSMAGSTYLNGNWTKVAYSRAWFDNINIKELILEKHSVPIFNTEIKRTKYDRPDNLITTISNGDTRDLSDYLFTYGRDPDYLALQVAVAGIGNIVGLLIGDIYTGKITGSDLAAALEFRGTVEENRKIIGPLIDKISSIPNLVTNTVISAYNAATSWSDIPWEAIKEETRDIFDLIDSLEDIKHFNFWDAVPLWTNEAWDATTKWSDEAWKSITEWTPETWEKTTQWTANDWDIPFLTISNPTVTENDSNNQELIFNVSLSTPSSETITVNYATEDGTATAGNDYTAINGTLTFAAGETNKSIIIPILDDNLLEEDETVYLNLAQSTNAHLTDNQAIATIINNVNNIANYAPEGLQFNVTVEGNILNLTDAWIYDGDGYQNLSYVDLWLQKEGEDWENIADITNFNPWENDNNWSIINHQIDLSDYSSGNYTIWAKGYDQQGLESNIITQIFDFTQVNIAPERLQFKTDKQNYAPTETLILEEAWVYDENGYSDVANVDFWVYSPDGEWIDVSDANSFSPWENDSDWASFKYSLNLTKLQGSGVGEHILWGQATDKNGATSNIVKKTFIVDNIAPSPTGLDGYFDIDAQVYISNDTLNINNGWVRDFNGVEDIQRIDFWLKKEGEAWQDIDDILSNEITPWSTDTTWGSFDYKRDLTGLTPGSYTLWSGVQDQELANNGTWANIVQNTFEIQA
ncbi:MAG: Calx-beta domain-containing protein [Crocosphaera sp.]